jgi:flagellar basal-body rod protein FlgF
MDRLIYLSMAGAKATMQRQEVLANNLANVSTNGFRAELQAFRAVPVRGDGASTRVYALESTVGANFSPGPVQATGRSLDVAMQGQSWLAVQGLDGVEAYTRAGSMTVDAQGTLMTSNGLTVLGDGGPITIPANARVGIASDGTVSATVGDGRPQAVGRLKLVTPAADAPLQRGEDGLFRAADGADLPADATARVQEGALEGSNVNAVETMVAMISAARQFEQQMKMLQTAERNEQSAQKLLSLTQ